MALTLASIRAIGVELSRELTSFDPALLSTSQAAVIVEAADHIVRNASALRTLAARRAVEGTVWRDDSRYATPGEWLAGTVGVAVGEATRTLQAAELLEDLPDVAESFRKGELSLPQVEAIAGAAATDPDAQRELLDAAKQKPFHQLKGLCRTVRNRARTQGEDEARAARHHELRRASLTTDDEGLSCLVAKLAPERMALVWGSVEAEADRLFELARAAGRRETPAALRADALCNLVTRGTAGTDGTIRSPRMLIRVDLAALQRGHAEPDEVCDIPGVGEIPVATARRLLPDSLLTFLVTDGVDIRTVATMRRHVPIAVELALRWRDPVCVVPRCDRTLRLERDHWRVEFAKGGETSLDNLCRICRPHHRDKTVNGYRLTGGPGGWEWHPPPPFQEGPDP